MLHFRLQVFFVPDFILQDLEIDPGALKGQDRRRAVSLSCSPPDLVVLLFGLTSFVDFTESFLDEVEL
jgi:hypothetical protein